MGYPPLIQHYKFGEKSELDSACRCFNFGVFSFGFFFCIHRDFCRIHWLCFPTTTEPYEGKCQGGNPFALANQGYTFSILTLKKGTNNLGSLGFHSQVYYSPRDKRGNIGLSLAWLTLQPSLSALETYKSLLQDSKRGLDITSQLIGSGLSNRPSNPVRAKVECC